MFGEVVAAEFVEALLSKKNAQRGAVVVEAIEETKPVLARVDFETLKTAQAIIWRDEINLRVALQAVMPRERLHERGGHLALKNTQIRVGRKLARRAHGDSGWL